MEIYCFSLLNKIISNTLGIAWQKPAEQAESCTMDNIIQ